MKYKLIKCYPGSPKLGTIVNTQDCDVFIYGSCNQLPITYSQIKKHPEFWQELPVYNKEWADSLVGNLFAVATHVKQYNPNMADRLDEYATELSDYFKDKLK